jgi:hypothetical protein
MNYVIRRAVTTPEFSGDWDGPAWGPADVVEVSHFHAKSSDHRPRTRAKLLYDDRGIHALFRVADRYVKCTRTEHQSNVCRDACVEFFVQPKPGHGYFNIEMNCGGTMLLYYLRDASRDANGKLANFQIVPPEELAAVRVHHSMPKSVPEEIVEPVEWWIEYFIPLALMERYVGPLGAPAQRRWRGNFYKCADDTSHPHWATWAPIERLDFHQPECFAPLTFE